MSKTAGGLRDVGAPQDPHTPKMEEIRAQLRAILSSPVFHGSKRSQQFLEYVCDKWLAGEASSLKERTIAIEVFGRHPESDLGEDTIVRVSAREVRKRLAQFYITPQGAGSEVRIELPSGSYAPEFRYAEEPARPAPAVVAPPRPRWKRHMLLAGSSLAVLGLAGVLAAELSGGDPNARVFQQFWDPVLKAPEPLLVAVAHPIVYHPSGRASKLSEENLPPGDTPLQRVIQVPPNKLTGADMVPVLNQYVGFGDMVVATEVSSMLARKSKRIRLRLASNIEFADLRGAQTLLIGSVTNRWTMEMQAAWRFRFNRQPGTKTVILDSQNATQWAVPAKDDGSAPDDYLLVSRIHSTYTGGLILVAAGLKQFGTEAAGRLLADPDQLGPILRKLPAGWEAKNIQFVLHARVIGNTPAQPEVMATQVW
jgi:hypothetical protein